jgi:hypothetical protein
MRPERISLEMIVNEIEARRVTKISSLLRALGCSSWTIFNKLKGYEYYTSINHSGQYITLKGIPEFDSNGMWKCKEAIFSQKHNVENTIVYLVNKSSEGLYVKELTNILQMSIHNQLHRCVKKGKLVRMRSGRNQIFFSSDGTIRKQQREERERTLERPLIKLTRKPKYINDELIITVLVAVIKHHETSPENICLILSSEGRKVSHSAVRWVFDKYQIEKKGSP